MIDTKDKIVLGNFASALIKRTTCRAIFNSNDSGIAVAATSTIHTNLMNDNRY